MHVRLGDEYVGGWETGLDRGQDVALRRRVVARDEPDSAGQEREAALAVGREQSLCCELRLQSLESREVRADTEALDRQCAKPEVAALLEELRTAV